jgi:hypothetical protein
MTILILALKSQPNYSFWCLILSHVMTDKVLIVFLGLGYNEQPVIINKLNTLGIGHFSDTFSRL